jgi:IK cytokine
LLNVFAQERERERQEKQQAVKAEAPMAAPVFKAPVKFETPLGRAVYEAACKPPPNRKALIREMFLPRRTAFVYDFDPDTGGGDVPTTLRRSKADCPPVQVRAAVLLKS